MRRTSAVIPDMTLFIAIVLLVSIGSVMVYTASAVLAADKFGSDTFFLERHLVRALVGLALMATVMQIDYRFWRKFSKSFLLIGFILLIAVLFPGVGGRASEITGANRWIKIASYTMQPVDIVKLIIILWLADSLDRKRGKLRNFSHGFLPHIFVVVITFTLIVVQPAFGSAFSLLAISLTILFVAGIKIFHISALTLSAVPILILLVVRTPYRLTRVLSFLNPNSDPLGASYHVRQSLIGLGSGGFSGVGLGHSVQKLLYLPEPHTDFIFTIVGEEFGFIGAMGILSLYLLIGWRGYAAAQNAPDFFGRLMAIGLTAMIFFGALINVAVVTGTIPATGLPLPLVSFGGSSIIFNLLGLGILLNISRHTKSEKESSLTSDVSS
ncbi:MAG: putative lipid II flippase FtsW [Candidatus Cloacimonetes bacterium 4572_55]|nr:MAG: putative lipid II flippase FtsW [Candidatus Cloacimonetes bacterium 4572_55]